MQTGVSTLPQPFPRRFRFEVWLSTCRTSSRVRSDRLAHLPCFPPWGVSIFPAVRCRPNPVLRQLLTTASFGAGGTEDDGWERVPSRANTIRMYTQDLGGALTANSPQSSGDGTSSSARRVCTLQQESADEVEGCTPSTQQVVRQAAAQHRPPRSEPLSILMASNYRSAPSARFSYESILSWVPPQWMPDSCAPACKGCCLPFKPVVRLRHHCRLCGLIFCHNCSSQKLLLPPKCAANSVCALHSACDPGQGC